VVGLTTVALIERKPSVSRDLFSRYWRDIHGVMAVRIPGFDSYTQYHVTPVGEGAPPFEGIAIVTFAQEDDVAGLLTSAVTKHIHRDEQNVFRRALLYSLAPGADRVLSGVSAGEGETLFHVVPEGVDPAEVADRLKAVGPAYLASYDLTTGDPSGWNDTDVDDGGSGSRFVAVLHSRWDGATPVIEAPVAAYRLDARYVMVENGAPTTIGLRGFDAARTIEEIGADNQTADDVVRAVYGDWARL
jgi:hypothetical protein